MSHREKECTEAYCIQGNGSHRGTAVRGETEVICQFY